jgi:hypothetical protein
MNGICIDKKGDFLIVESGKNLYATRTNDSAESQIGYFIQIGESCQKVIQRFQNGEISYNYDFRDNE